MKSSPAPLLLPLLRQVADIRATVTSNVAPAAFHTVDVAAASIAATVRKDQNRYRPRRFYHDYVVD